MRSRSRLVAILALSLSVATTVFAARAEANNGDFVTAARAQQLLKGKSFTASYAGTRVRVTFTRIRCQGIGSAAYPSGTGPLWSRFRCAWRGGDDHGFSRGCGLPWSGTLILNVATGRWHGRYDPPFCGD